MLHMMYDVIINKKQQSEQGQRYDISRERNFVICRSCFWCASLLSNTQRPVETCPLCMNSTLESMPICFDETYRLDYDSRRGITLEFGRTK